MTIDTAKRAIDRLYDIAESVVTNHGIPARDEWFRLMHQMNGVVEVCIVDGENDLWREASGYMWKRLKQFENDLIHTQSDFFG